MRFVPLNSRDPLLFMYSMAASQSFAGSFDHSKSKSGKMFTGKKRRRSWREERSKSNQTPGAEAERSRNRAATVSVADWARTS